MTSYSFLSAVFIAQTVAKKTVQMVHERAIADRRTLLKELQELEDRKLKAQQEYEDRQRRLKEEAANREYELAQRQLAIEHSADKELERSVNNLS